MSEKKALVCGAGGFIGSHLVKRLRKEGFWVRGVDLKFPEFGETEAHDFMIGDLRDPMVCRAALVLHSEYEYACEFIVYRSYCVFLEAVHIIDFFLVYT